MKNISFLLLCMLMGSCKDSEPRGEFKSCDFPASTKILILSNKHGVLNYSKSIEGILVNDYSYYIKTDGQLPMLVCNMPESVQLEKDSKVSVTFSGRMEVLSDQTDAVSTNIELAELKF